MGESTQYDGSARSFTDAQLNLIEIQAGLGLSDAEVAATVEVPPAMLRNESAQMRIQRGKALARLRVAEASYKLAVSGRSVIATIHWLKSVAGWSETLPSKPSQKNHEVTFQTKIGNNGQIISNQEGR